MGIQPEQGTKCSKGKRRKREAVSPPVIFRNVADFAWMDKWAEIVLSAALKLNDLCKSCWLTLQGPCHFALLTVNVDGTLYVIAFSLSSEQQLSFT